MPARDREGSQGRGGNTLCLSGEKGGQGPPFPGQEFLAGVPEEGHCQRPQAKWTPLESIGSRRLTCLSVGPTIGGGGR